MKSSIYLQIKSEIDTNKSIRIDRSNKAKMLARRAKEAFLLDFRCIDCGEGDPLFLEFDLKDDVVLLKGRTLARLSNNGATKQIIDEMESNYVVRCLLCQRLHLAATGKDARINERLKIMKEAGMRIRRKDTVRKHMKQLI